jgi:hypothetical protein
VSCGGGDWESGMSLAWTWKRDEDEVVEVVMMGQKNGERALRGILRLAAGPLCFTLLLFLLSFLRLHSSDLKRQSAVLSIFARVPEELSCR